MHEFSNTSTHLSGQGRSEREEGCRALSLSVYISVYLLAVQVTCSRSAFTATKKFCFVSDDIDCVGKFGKVGYHATHSHGQWPCIIRHGEATRTHRAPLPAPEMETPPSTQESQEGSLDNKLGHMEKDGPCWADMLPDALAKIFSRLSMEDMLINIPQVCQSWRRASQDAVCWQKVDLEEWRHGRGLETSERMVAFLVNRSRGCLREICAPKLHNDNMLRMIAWSGSPLQVLRIPQSLVTEDCLCQMAPHFTYITFLDLSGCIISKASVESFGKHCRVMVRLNLNMYPQTGAIAVSDDMAFAIAQYMPQLKHLEMAYGGISNLGLKAVLDKCVSLEHLDLRGCWQLNTEESFFQEAVKRLKVFHPPVVENDIYNTDESDLDASDIYDDSDYFDEDMWYDSELEDLDDLIMEMHEEEINGTLYFWPDTSPPR